MTDFADSNEASLSVSQQHLDLAARTFAEPVPTKRFIELDAKPVAAGVDHVPRDPVTAFDGQRDRPRDAVSEPMSPFGRPLPSMKAEKHWVRGSPAKGEPFFPGSKPRDLAHQAFLEALRHGHFLADRGALRWLLCGQQRRGARTQSRAMALANDLSSREDCRSSRRSQTWLVACLEPMRTLPTKANQS